MQTIEITISGGAVQYVDFPRGIKVIVRDYDVEGGDLDGPDIRKDEEGDCFQNMEFIHDEDRDMDRQNSKTLPEPVPAARAFKLWVSIEAIQEKRGVYADLGDMGFIEPVSLGVFSRLRQALQWILDLPGCRKDERDENVLARANEIERQIWRRLSTPAAQNAAAIPPARLAIDLSGVDWKLLRRQKESLVNAISIVDVQIGKKCQTNLNGILHLLDHVQDEAAEQLGDAAIFGRSTKTNPRL
jgi:hypothetical protein